MRKRWPMCAVLVAATLLLATARPAVAGRSASGAPGQRGPGPSRSAWGTGSHGNAVVPPRGTWHSGVRGPVAGPHPPFVHDSFRGHPGGRTRIVIGSGFWWGPPWWWGPSYPDYYPAPPVDIQQEPPAEQPSYWYYCQNPPGYYPYVRECAGGWMTVVPPANAPAGGPPP